MIRAYEEGGKYKVEAEICWDELSDSLQLQILNLLQRMGDTEAQSVEELEEEFEWDVHSLGKMQLFSLPIN